MGTARKIILLTPMPDRSGPVLHIFVRYWPTRKPASWRGQYVVDADIHAFVLRECIEVILIAESANFLIVGVLGGTPLEAVGFYRMATFMPAFYRGECTLRSGLQK
jgi:hypothetical protein